MNRSLAYGYADCKSELKPFSRARPAHQGPACICAPNLGALAISTQLTVPLKTLDRQHSDPMTPLLRRVVENSNL